MPAAVAVPALVVKNVSKLDLHNSPGLPDLKRDDPVNEERF